VVHTCNTSYSGGRDQKDCDSKPTQASSSWDPIMKKTITKKGWWSGSRDKVAASKHEALSSNPSTTKKEEKDYKILHSDSFIWLELIEDLLGDFGDRIVNPNLQWVPSEGIV
jgi:hypothetical protein